MIKKYVVFLSPGTFCNEESRLEINSWDIQKATEMSKEINERYNSKPYGFYFITKERNDNELDSKIIQKSNMYYINGIISTLEELKIKNDPQDKILISNMECNKWNRVVTTYSPWKWTQPLNDEDVVLTVK